MDLDKQKMNRVVKHFESENIPFNKKLMSDKTLFLNNVVWILFWLEKRHEESGDANCKYMFDRILSVIAVKPQPVRSAGFGLNNDARKEKKLLEEQKKKDKYVKI